MDLLRRSLCEDSADYESLIANMSIVLNTLDCNEDGKVILTQPGAIILKNMFDPTETVEGISDGFWKDCFGDRNVYYYDKSCGYQSKIYEPASGSDPCVEEAKTIVGAVTGDCNPTDADYPVFVEAPSIVVTQQGSVSIPEVTTVVFAAIPAAGEYLVLYSQCSNLQYIFWFSDGENSAPGVEGLTDEIPVMIGGSISITTTNLFNAINGYNGGINWTTVDIVPGAGEGDPDTPLTITHSINNVPVGATTFKECAEAYACYLGALTGEETLEDVQKVMLAFCGLLKNRIGFDRVLNKTMLTISKCDL
jgi:hypothetical protein